VSHPAFNHIVYIARKMFFFSEMPLYVSHWFLTFFEVQNPASFIRAFIKHFPLGTIFLLWTYVYFVHRTNHAFVHEVTVFREQNINFTQKQKHISINTYCKSMRLLLLTFRQVQKCAFPWQVPLISFSQQILLLSIVFLSTILENDSS